MPYKFIDRQQDLDTWIDRVSDIKVIGLDTEFLWERTYFPKLCLIQIAADDSIACIDTLALDDLSSVNKMMNVSNVQKIFHAAKQDIEVLQVAGLEAREQIFDTQVAAGLLGMAEQIGYGDLVETLVGIRLEKSQTRTDWTSRPLNVRQLDYAANDVKYLAEMTEIMSEKLLSLGRFDWCLEDCRRLQQPHRSVLAPWERISGIGKLETGSFAIAVNIAVWRDDKAKEMDLPRGWVFSDKQILSIAVEKPKTLKELSSILNDKPNILRKFSENLLELVDTDGLVSSLSVHRKNPLSIAQRKRAKEIKKKIATIAADLGIGSSLLCTSKEVEACLHGDVPERISTGWRQYIVCDLLESI